MMRPNITVDHSKSIVTSELKDENDRLMRSYFFWAHNKNRNPEEFQHNYAFIVGRTSIHFTAICNTSKYFLFDSVKHKKHLVLEVLELDLSISVKEISSAFLNTHLTTCSLSASLPIFRTATYLVLINNSVSGQVAFCKTIYSNLTSLPNSLLDSLTTASAINIDDEQIYRTGTTAKEKKNC